MQRVAIVDPNDSTREPLKNLLLTVDSIWIDAESNRYEFFLDIVQESQPDLAIVTLDSDQSKALQLIGQLAGAFPKMSILAISGRNDGNMILQALRSGAKEFLTQSLVLEELLKVLQRLGGETTVGPSSSSSVVIAVLGSRGGVGCTSLAVNLGCSLAADKNNSVALMDLDLALGDADVALDLVPTHTLADVVGDTSRLDMQFLKRALCQHSSGLALLSRPVGIEELGLIHEDHLQRAIGLVKASKTHLVIDLSKGFMLTDYTAMRMADIILLVCQLELTSLRNTVRILLAMESEPGLTEKIRVVVNRVGSDFTEGDIGLDKATETIGKPIFWQIPNDYKAMVGARNSGVPLIQHDPKCKAQKSIMQLADALCGKTEQAAEPPKKEKKGGWSLFGR